MNGTRELNLTGTGRGPSDGSVGTGTDDAAFDREKFAGRAHDRREAILDLDQSSMRGADQVFDGRSAAMEDREAHSFVAALPVGSRVEARESDAPIRENDAGRSR